MESWLLGFHGVSTRWLSNYLNLFEFRVATRGLDSLTVRRRLLVDAAALPRATCPSCGGPRILTAA